jgi:ribose transport system ATP-binding protein
MEASVQEVPLLEMRGIAKAFPGVQALDDVSLEARAGEVHALVGQNGAGKSTLMKVLCGASQPDRGEIFFRGRATRIASPADARRLGVAVIFQEFSLVPYLNIAHNIFLGRELRGRMPGSIDHRRMHAEARRLLALLGMDVDTRTLAHKLGVAQQQLVEIAKALSQQARVLVMDEPTAALSEREIERLFEMIRRLKREGVAIIYISHRLREVFAIGDRITVLRDGRKVASLSPEATSMDELVRMMVGREVDTTYRHRFCAQAGEPVLEVSGVHADNGVRNASLTVRAGEIVGLAGLVGAGRSELARAIFGADRTSRGEIRVHGRPLHDAAWRSGPVRSVRAGVGLVPEARKSEGLALIRSVQDNLLAAALPSLFPRRWYRPRRAMRVAADLIGRLRVATPSTQRLTQFLSGGNQQKVVVGKWLAAGSRLFIFDEPTRGIDVGAKAEIFGLIEELVSQGAAALMISSELPEIVAVCDRAYVMRDKTIVGELARGDLTEENILRLAMHHG